MSILTIKNEHERKLRVLGKILNRLGKEKSIHYQYWLGRVQQEKDTINDFKEFYLK